MSLPESLRPAFAAALRAQTGPELVAAIAGGTSPSTRPHMHYYAGFAYGTEYIGPMKGI